MAMGGLLALAYAVVLQQCWVTMGEPFRLAELEIAALRDTGAGAPLTIWRRVHAVVMCD